MEIKWNKGIPTDFGMYLVRTIEGDTYALIYDPDSNIWSDEYYAISKEVTDQIEYFILLDTIVKYLDENTNLIEK